MWELAKMRSPIGGFLPILLAQLLAVSAGHSNNGPSKEDDDLQLQQRQQHCCCCSFGAQLACIRDPSAPVCETCSSSKNCGPPDVPQPPAAAECNHQFAAGHTVDEALIHDNNRNKIKALLDAMEDHFGDLAMVKRCCIALTRFNLPNELAFHYLRVFSASVKLLDIYHFDTTLQTTVLSLMYSIAAHLNVEQKAQVAQLDTVELALRLIGRRMQQQKRVDMALILGWAFLANISDRSATIVRRFMDAQGLAVFAACTRQLFNGSRQREADQENYRAMLHIMMQVAGNIADFQEHRKKLLTEGFVNMFRALLLNNFEEGIDLSFGAARVLAQLISEGEEAWKSAALSRSRVEMDNSLITTIEQWDTPHDAHNSLLVFSTYRPLLHLLDQWKTPGAQLWSVWTLATASGACPVVKPSEVDQKCREDDACFKKYAQAYWQSKHHCCKLLIEEGAVGLLLEVVLNKDSVRLASAKARTLAKITLDNINAWKSKRTKVAEMII